MNKAVTNGEVTGYRTVYFRNADDIRASPNIVYVNVETGEVGAVEVKTGGAKESTDQKMVFKNIKENNGNVVPTRLLFDLVGEYNEARPAKPISKNFVAKIGEVVIEEPAGITD